MKTPDEWSQAMRSRERREAETWLAARYHMPLTYSCRAPMSNPASGVALPTPGPATVQLAMIRTGIELFDADYVRERLFKHIVSSQPKIRPPWAIAVSEQPLSVLKTDTEGGLFGGFGYRQVAHAYGDMVIYVNVDMHVVDDASTVLQGIGYWGQTSSFACCTEVWHEAPDIRDCMRPVEDVRSTIPLSAFYVGHATELSGPSITWEDIIDTSGRRRTVIRRRLFAWPLVHYGRRGIGYLLRHRSFDQV